MIKKEFSLRAEERFIFSLDCMVLNFKATYIYLQSNTFTLNKYIITIVNTIPLHITSL